jgi:hypothetical protein
MVDVLTEKFGQATVDGYRKSLQSRGLLPQTVLRTIDSVAFPAAVLAALAFGAASVRRGRQQEIALVALVVSGFVINAVLCGFVIGGI